MKIHFIGGGTTELFSAGDASVAELPDGSLMGIDFNSAAGGMHLAEEYARLGITRLDRLVISHYHHDHVNGIYTLFETGRLRVDSNTTVYLPDDAAMQQVRADPESEYGKIVYFVYPAILELLRSAGCRLVWPREGEAVDAGGAVMRFYNTDHGFYQGKTLNYNDWSLCMSLEYGPCSVFFPGDSGPVAEAHMAPGLPPCTVLKAQHHGWENNIMCEAYINALNPRAVVSMDGTAHDKYIMDPTSPLQTWCEEHDVPNYRTRQNGTITLNMTETDWGFEGSPKRMLRRDIRS